MLTLDPVKWFGLTLFIVEMEQKDLLESRVKPTATASSSVDSSEVKDGIQGKKGNGA